MAIDVRPTLLKSADGLDRERLRMIQFGNDIGQRVDAVVVLVRCQQKEIRRLARCPNRPIAGINRKADITEACQSLPSP